MRTALLLAAACTFITAQGQEFDLGPKVVGPNTATADPSDTKLFGLNGANVVPGPGSTGTGDEDGQSGNIFYDAGAKVLHIGIGWGSHDAVGGTDLSGNVTIADIHTSSGPGTAGSQLYSIDLVQDMSPSGAGSETGFIEADIQLIEGTGGFSIVDQEEQLRGGLWYLDLHTAGFPDGEIRGQLLQAVPEPEHYAMMAGLALLGFAGYRKYKFARA